MKPNEIDKVASANMQMVADSVFALVCRLADEGGIPQGQVIAAAHAQTVAMLAVTFGGDVAAERCRNAAAQVETLPSVCDLALASAPTQGRA